jgi:hypothetical protein
MALSRLARLPWGSLRRGARRAQLTPADVGSPMTTHLRMSAASSEEFAQLASSSVDYHSLLRCVSAVNGRRSHPPRRSA